MTLKPEWQRRFAGETTNLEPEPHETTPLDPTKTMYPPSDGTVVDHLRKCSLCGGVTRRDQPHAHEPQEARDQESVFLGSKMARDVVKDADYSTTPLVERLHAANEWLGSFSFDRAARQVAKTCLEAASDLEELQTEASENQECIDRMVLNGREAIERLDLSTVPDKGSLKNDEAWGAIEILEKEIVTLRGHLLAIAERRENGK